VVAGRQVHEVTRHVPHDAVDAAVHESTGGGRSRARRRIPILSVRDGYSALCSWWNNRARLSGGLSGLHVAAAIDTCCTRLRLACREVRYKFKGAPLFSIERLSAVTGETA